MTLPAIPLNLRIRDTDGEIAPFLPYTEVPRRVSREWWGWLRWASVTAYVSLVVLLIADPPVGLLVLWGVVVPLLPALFFVAPGVWRNTCPLAAANQLPRSIGRSRALHLPAWLGANGHLVAITVFAAAVIGRRLLLNGNGPATALVLVLTVSAAFAGGLAFRGKSGWCSSVCPLLPVQRLYGQTPFVSSPNSHCAPCVGCTKNCYDFNPAVAYQADLTDDDPDWGASRRLFAGLFPGLVVGYFWVPGPPATSTAEFIALFLATAAVAAGLYFALQAVTHLSWAKVTALWGAAAFTMFYWFTGPVLQGSVQQVTGADLPWLRWPIRVVALLLAITWLARTFEVEQRFLAVLRAESGARLDEGALRELQEELHRSETPRVTVVPDDREILTQPGLTLLDVVESAGLPLEAGCRLGQCGADPVSVVSGAANLAPVTDDERTTLRRLCLSGNNRLACQAVVLGDCTIALTPDRSTRKRASVTTGPSASPTAGAPVPLQGGGQRARRLGRVVVIGGGIAGVSVAEQLRSADPDCHITVINQEPHHLYNRMGISRVIYGRTAMSGLYLLPEDWFETQAIESWLNTMVRRVDLASQTVHMATGETVGWDHLVMATGSRPTIPALSGYGLPGSFALREASVAAEIRSTVQRTDARTAVVGGGGLLGLEAAYSLHRLGLRVTVLERASRLLSRNVDVRASELLSTHLEKAGIGLITGITAVGLTGRDRVTGVDLDTGASLPADVFLTAVGITPNSEIAREAGLEVGRGVTVDRGMRTSDPRVHACGDVAELEGRVWGLWPTAVRQAEVVATNLLGGDALFTASDPPMVLKGVGVDLTSVGDITAGDGTETILHEDPSLGAYAKLVVAGGRIRGGILFGYKREVPHLQRLVTEGTDIENLLDRLRAGEIDALVSAVSR